MKRNGYIFLTTIAFSIFFRSGAMVDYPNDEWAPYNQIKPNDKQSETNDNRYPNVLSLLKQNNHSNVPHVSLLNKNDYPSVPAIPVLNKNDYPEVDPVSVGSTPSFSESKIIKHLKAYHCTKDHEKRIKRQIKLLKKQKPGGKNFNTLGQMTASLIAISEESLKDLESDFDTAVVKANLFELDNSRISLIHAIDFAMDKYADSNFIMQDNTLPQKISQNAQLKRAVDELDTALKDPKQNASEQQVQIMRLLRVVYRGIINDTAIDNESPFPKFIQGMIKTYQVTIARRITDEVMTRFRGDVENSLQKSSDSTSVAVGANGNISGVDVGASASFHRDEGGSDTSFFTVSVGGGINFSIGVGALEVGAGIDITRSAIFFSLEQVLDSGELKSTVLKSKQIKEMKKYREKMQDRERKLLAIFGNNVEGFLKMISVIPINVYLEWPIISRADSVERATNISGSLSASLSFFESLGFTVTANKDVKVFERPIGYLTLLSPDCSPTDGYSAKSITAFIGQQYDFSQRYGSRSDENVLPIILGDLREYCNILAILAENPSDGASEQRKHDIEKRWLPKKIGLTSEGREGVLKSMIVTLANLRETTNRIREIELFKQAYSELLRLEKLHEFSKNKKHRRATFVAKAKATNWGISGSIELPYGIMLAFTRTGCKNNPGLDDNGDYLQIDIIVPSTISGVIALQVLRNWIITTSTRLGYSPHREAREFRDALLTCLSAFSSISALSGSSVFTLMMIRSDANEDSSDIKALPGVDKAIIKHENKWVVQYMQVTTNIDINLSLGLPVGRLLATLDLSKSISKKEKIIGNNTLTFITARYNSWALGLNDKSPATKHVNTPWIDFSAEQAEPLKTLFLNVDDEDSNVRYELQNIYGAATDNAKNKTEVAHCEKCFSNFLRSCSALKKSVSTANYRKAVVMFDEVLKCNHKYVFLPEFNTAFQQ